MKFKYIFAALALSLAVACQQEPIGTLSEIQVSESYVSIDVNGGSTTIELKAGDSWQVDAASVPEWLTVSPMSGSAGEVKLTFSSAATTSTQTAEVKINCGGRTQYVNVIQFAEKADPVLLSVSEALALIKTIDKGDGQSYNVDGEYYVKGIVCRITEISTSYGNATYYLSDDGSYTDGAWLQVYRGYWYNGGNFTSEDAFAVGDELTICGQLMSYKGTPETVEKTAYVVEVKKSLIKIDSVDPEDGVIPSEGGNVTVKLDNKGNGLYVEVPAEAKSWLSISSLNGSSVTFSATENTGSPRSADLVFSTTDGSNNYTAQVTISQNGSIVDATAAEINAAEDGSTQYRVTGYVSSIASDLYGNMYIVDYTGTVYIYGTLDADGNTKNFASLGIKAGDIVTVVGPKSSYKGDPQMVNVSVEKHFSVEDVTVADFLAKSNSNDVYYRLTGTAANVKDNDQYGNFDIVDETGSVYVYGLLSGFGGPKQKFLDLGIKNGDKVVLIGCRGSYGDTQEVVNAFYVSHESAE